MREEPKYERANDEKYERQVLDGLRSLYSLEEMLTKNQSWIKPERFTFYQYFTLRQKKDLMETMNLSSFESKIEQEKNVDIQEVQKQIEEMEKQDQNIKERFETATKRIGKLGDVYGIGAITKRVQEEIEKKQKGQEKEIGE